MLTKRRMMEMAVRMYWYPKCGTCRNAKKWLESNGIAVEEIHIDLTGDPGVGEVFPIEFLRQGQNTAGDDFRTAFY